MINQFVLAIDGCIGAANLGDGAYRLDFVGVSRLATDEELLIVTRKHKKSELAAARYAAEIGGMTWNGWPIDTDERARISMLGAVMQVQMGLWSGGWKFADGVFRELTGEQVVTMSSAVGAHVAACFAQEATRLAELESAETLEAINAVVW